MSPALILLMFLFRPLSPDYAFTLPLRRLMMSPLIDSSHDLDAAAADNAIAYFDAADLR